MEELKSLIGVLKDMPDMVIWLVAFYFFFKVVVVGSIYGTIKLAITKLHGWALKKKEPDVTVEQYPIVLDNKVISEVRENPEEFKKLIERIGKRHYYIFQHDIDVVNQALDMWEEKNGVIKPYNASSAYGAGGIGLGVR